MTDPADARTRLLSLLVRYSFRCSTEPEFRLASGKTSRYYVDCRATTMRAAGMLLVGTVLSEHIPETAQAVGGLTLGADPIAMATAFTCSSTGRPLHAFSVRKEAKQHGLRRWVEGCVEAGSRVVVVDDVVTTGASTIRAIRRCREEDLEVVAVLALVDRQEENGLVAVSAEAGSGTPVRAIFNRTELEEALALNVPRD